MYKLYMKFSIRFFLLAVSLCITLLSFGQYNWELSKDKDGIKVYLSEVKNSSFKSIKVECTCTGTYTKLINIISTPSLQKDWVYNNKTAYLVKRISPVEFYYYTETAMQWPVSNRDAVLHVKIMKDSLNRFLDVNIVSESTYLAPKKGLVRVPRASVHWHVTMPSNNTVSIVYILDVDPGGSLPAWLVNIFLDKGPYESFEKLKGLLKQ
jgi:hypothetical protein